MTEPRAPETNTSEAHATVKVPQNPRRRPVGVDAAMVQSHYDVSDAFYALFLDSSMTYSCAKFDSPESTLEEAQLAKIDLSLGKLNLVPGEKLLDIGCGWGATARRAATKYGVDVVGLTLSRTQFEHDVASVKEVSSGAGRIEFRLEGWETFEPAPGEPRIDKIVSIGAFEHFGRAKYAQFFEKCRALLPADGLMLLHTITAGKPSTDWDFFRFVHFIATEIFPGGDVPAPEAVIAAARAGGFELLHSESLRLHYARTLDCWASRLKAREAEALALVGEVVVARYMKYLTGCADLFRSGECNIQQFRLRVV